METKVIKSACSANYLNMMKQMAVAQENWSFLYPYNPTNPVPLENYQQRYCSRKFCSC